MSRAPVLLLPALALLAAAPTASAAAPTSDTPGGAKPFAAVTAGNPPNPVTQQAVLELRDTTADAGTPRCLGPSSFAHTSWAWLPPAAVPRLVRASATPLSPTPTTTTSAPITTAVPDLAVFVQPGDGGPTRPSTTEPQLCDGRDVLGDPARTDANPEVVLVLPAGRGALVQTGWRSGDPQAQIVATADARPVATAAAPAGDEPEAAPVLAAPGRTTVRLAGATVGEGDPAEPVCQARATVWRRLRLAPGRYTATADGAAGTLTAFGDRITGDAALACAEAGDGRGLTVRLRRTTSGPVWLRVGTDASTADAVSRLVVRRARATPGEARAAAADALVACTRRSVVLDDVRRRGASRVRVAGSAGTSAAGRRVVVRVVGTRRAAGSVRVGRDGTFSRTLVVGAAARRTGARYVATLGRARSASVLLPQRVGSVALRRAGTRRATFRARLTGPLATSRTVRLQRATCTGGRARWRTVRTVRRTAGGAITGTVARPSGDVAIVVRAVATVRIGRTGRTVAVRSLPRAVGF